jgi:RTX calcium-binding nonapeptide repeat (4 copies)
MRTTHVGSRRSHTMITIAALAAALSVALIAAVTVHAGGVPDSCRVANIGTSGNDIICGTHGANSMDGGAGDDDIYGRGGVDSITGNAGNDFIHAGSDNDTVTGATGEDTIFGDEGHDILNGGSGTFDILFGGEGNDRLSVRDGAVDDGGQCGSGTDRYDMDLVDVPNHIFPTFTIAGSCETVTVGAVNEGPNVVISPNTPKIKDNGKVPVRLSCPDSLAAACAGTLQVGSSEKSQGALKTYSLAPGASRKVTARLSQKDRRKLSQGEKLTAAASSIEQGEFGDKTTVQTLELRGKRHT